jgi:hypothetical protein
MSGRRAEFVPPVDAPRWDHAEGEGL